MSKSSVFKAEIIVKVKAIAVVREYDGAPMDVIEIDEVLEVIEDSVEDCQYIDIASVPN